MRSIIKIGVMLAASLVAACKGGDGTTAATAAAAHLLLGLPWPVGFVLGAIVSPPDTMAPSSMPDEWGSPDAF